MLSVSPQGSHAPQDVLQGLETFLGTRSQREALLLASSGQRAREAAGHST